MVLSPPCWKQGIKNILNQPELVYGLVLEEF